MKSIDTLISENPNLHKGIQILICGILNKNPASSTLYDWDEHRYKDSIVCLSNEEKTTLPSGTEEIIYKMARLLRNTDGLYPSQYAQEAGKALLALRNLDTEKYDKLVIDKGTG